jgi:hypothetical protein
LKDSRVKLVSLSTLSDILAVLDEIETIYQQVET